MPGTRVLGLRETLLALDRMGPLERLGARRELAAAADEIAMLARTYVHPTGLSGWGRWKGGYDAAAIIGGIGVTATRESRSEPLERTYVAVVNATAAGAIWELAGGASDGKPSRAGRRRKRRRVLRPDGKWGYSGFEAGGKSYGNGAAMVAAIRSRSARAKAGHLAWAAYDATDAGRVRDRLDEMASDVARRTQSAIDHTSAR